MGEQSKIEWTDATWNPWQGCTWRSEACDHCYMFRGMRRYGRNPEEVRRSASPTFRLPLARTREGEFKIPDGSKVFTCSWSDWFHESADGWRKEAWDIIRQRPGVTFQIVTKRTERIADCLPADWGSGWPNVWLLATTESQKWFDIRSKHLLQIPAIVHGLSCEPLLEEINITPFLLPIPGSRWVIAGGESGPEARPTHGRWSRSLRDQCQAYAVPFFFKQHGEWIAMDDYDPFTMPRMDRCRTLNMLPDGRSGSAVTGEICRRLETLPTTMIRVGVEAAGALLDGREWREFPDAVCA